MQAKRATDGLRVSLFNTLTVLVNFGQGEKLASMASRYVFVGLGRNFGVDQCSTCTEQEKHWSTRHSVGTPS